MIPLISTLVLVTGLCVTPAQAASWHQGLCLGNSDLWRGRVPIDVRNDTPSEIKGRPVAMRIGRGLQQADLAGVHIESLRVCDDAGQEMLYNVIDPQGNEIHTGPIAEGSQLVVPAQCAAGTTARYWAYFDNPSAWGVPDWLSANLGVRNGGFESGDGANPAGWRTDTMDAQHRIAWVDEDPRSGQRCMKTSVDAGAPSTWIATRQADLPIIGGARYVMRAWVKAQEVVGYAGWYIHVGNEKNFMLTAPMLSGGPGSVRMERSRRRIHGTGRSRPRGFRHRAVWHRHRLVRRGVARVPGTRALVSNCRARESLEFTQSGADAPWYDNDPTDHQAWDYRVPVRVANFSDAPAATGLISVDLAGVFARLRGRAARKSAHRFRWETRQVVSTSGPVTHRGRTGPAAHGAGLLSLCGRQ